MQVHHYPHAFSFERSHSRNEATKTEKHQHREENAKSSQWSSSDRRRRQHRKEKVDRKRTDGGASASTVVDDDAQMIEDVKPALLTVNYKPRPMRENVSVAFGRSRGQAGLRRIRSMVPTPDQQQHKENDSAGMDDD